MFELTKRQKIDYEIADLRNQRSSYEPQWMDVDQYIWPYRLKLNLPDYGRGERRNTKIYDSTAWNAMRAVGSGLTSAATDPAGQWFRFSTKDPERAEFGPHREWLDLLGNSVMSVLAGSNTYVTLPTLYRDMAGFATGVVSIEEDFTGKVIHTRSFQPGSYLLGQDDKGNVNVFWRECRMTVRQLYLQFGEDGQFSDYVQNLIDTSRWETYVDVAHIVWPNDEYKPGNPRSKHKRFASCWYETGTQESGGSGDMKFLRESGFDEFPFLCGRWEQQEGEVWGIDCPAMVAIGDVKGLQIGERREGQLIEKGINPHWVGAPELKGRDHGFLPGQITFLEERGGTGMVPRLRPLHEVNPAFLPAMEEKQAQMRQRINTAFYYDLFSMFDTLPDKERTATEIMERKSEKLIKLVSMYANLTSQVLRPFIDRVFYIMQKQQLIPPPPPDLQGHELEYEFLGILAQAQKMLRVQPIERLFGSVAQMAAVKPDIIDKLDIDQGVDEIATGLGVPATVVNSDDKVAAIRQQRAQAQQAAAAAEQAKTLAGAAKDLGQTPVDQDNALTRVMDTLGAA